MTEHFFAKIGRGVDNSVPPFWICFQCIIFVSLQGYLKVSIQIIGPDDVPEDLSKRGLHYTQDTDEIEDRYVHVGRKGGKM